jgi:WD40 repeat protein
VPTTKSPSTAQTTALIVSSGSAGQVQSVPAIHAPSTAQTITPKPISLDNVLAELETEQQEVIRRYCPGTSADVNTSIQQAIDHAEEKKRLCIEKRWKMTIGTKTIVLRDKADLVISLANKFKHVGSVAVGADPVHAGLPWAGVCLLLQIAIGQKEQMDALMDGMITALSIHRTADLYVAFYNGQSAGPQADELRRFLLKLYATDLGFLAEALALWEATGVSRFWSALSSDGDLQKFASRCREVLKDVERSATLCDRQLAARTEELVADLKANVTGILGQLEDIRIRTARIRTELDLAKLSIAPNAAFDSYDQQNLSTCLPNTRVSLLDEIDRWVDNPADTCIFWLQGIAGEGKSTVAKTIATTLYAQKKLDASFFFKRDDIDRSNGKRFFTTMAAQLAQKIDGLKDAIAKVLDDEVAKYEKSIRGQFNDLIANPLQDLAQSSQPNVSGVFIVVDALDECSDEDVKIVLELLARINQCGHFGIRTFVTGRPDVPVRNAFSGLNRVSYQQLVLQDSTRTTIDHDIALFLTEQFREIRTRVPVLHNDWPGKDMIQKLTQRSVPLFIFAATVCKFVDSDDFTPEEQLQAVLAEASSVPLARTYLPVLNRTIADKGSKQSAAIVERFRNMVGPIILAAEPMPVEFVIHMSRLANREQLKARLGRLHSVLHLGTDDGKEDQTIHPFHTSFRNFLVEPDEPHNFQIDERQAHISAFNACLTLMMQTGRLQQDICAVSKPGTRRLNVDTQVVKSHIKPELAYACRYWVFHLAMSEELIDDTYEIYKSLTQYYLYWFGAMAWLGKAYEVLHSIKRLRTLVQVSCPCVRCLIFVVLTFLRATASTDSLSILDDAYHFTRENTYIADLAPLQLYASALVFAPQDSLMKSSFRSCMPQWLPRPPRVLETWNHDTLTLNGHTSLVTALAFSPDDRYLASCTEFGMLSVCDATTGECVSEFSVRQLGCKPFAIALSTNNNRIAVAHGDESFLEPSRGFFVTTHNFEDGTEVRMFNRQQTGRPSNQLDHVSAGMGICLAFKSGTSDMLAVATLEECMLEVWCTGVHSDDFERVWGIDTRPYNPNFFQGLAVSMESSLILASLHDGSLIASWDLETGTPGSTHSLEEHSHGFLALHGTDIIFETRPGHSPPVLKRLDTQNGPVEIFSESCRNYAMAYANNKLAHTSLSTNVIQISILPKDLTMETETRMESNVWQVQVTGDGEKTLVDYFDHLELRDAQGKIWSTSPITLLRVFTALCQPALSHDGNVIALKVECETLVWNVGLGRLQRVPDMESEILPSPVLSNDGKLIVFLSTERLVVWDLETNHEFRSIDTANKIPISWIVFSEDDKVILTSQGNLDLGTGHWDPADGHVPCSDVKPLLGLSEGWDWVRFCDEDLLWLPNRYRATQGQHSSKNTITLAQDKSVMTMRIFDPHGPFLSTPGA